MRHDPGITGAASVRSPGCDLANPVRAALDRIAAEGRPALCQFVIAGDPDPATAADLAAASVAAGVDLFEYCIPFPRSITDGPVIRAGYERAIAAGMTPERALAGIAPLARHRPVVLLADWRATVLPMGGVEPFLDRAAAHGAGAVLLHGLPPLVQPQLGPAAARRGLGVVATAYPDSPAATLARAAREATAFLYLVSARGRSGGAPPDLAALAPVIARLRAEGAGRIGVGFGLKTAADHRAARDAGADLTICGSAFTALIDRHAGDRAALLRAWRAALLDLASRKETAHADA